MDKAGRENLIKLGPRDRVSGEFYVLLPEEDEAEVIEQIERAEPAQVVEEIALKLADAAVATGAVAIAKTRNSAIHKRAKIGATKRRTRPLKTKNRNVHARAAKRV